MITQKQIQRALRFARPVLLTRFSQNDTQTMLDAMQNNYQALASQVPNVQSPFNQMFVRISVDAAAFYRVLPDKLRQTEKFDLMQSFVNNWMDGQFEKRLARKIYANPILHRLFRKFWFAMCNRAGEPDGQKFEYLPPQGNLFYGVNVIQCGNVKFLEQMGMPEIGPLLCEGDRQICKYLPPGVDFRRTQTIAEGAAYCDFRYIFVNDQEKL